MSTAFAINYDLKKPGSNYDGLHAEIKKTKLWWHYLGSTWLVITDETVEQISARLRAQIDASDFMLIIEVRKNADGWMPQEAWDWIKTYVP